MFTIKGGKDKFTQWDLNQQVLNPCMNAGDEVVFRNASGAAIVQYAHKDGSDVVADVPNILLQDSRNIVVDLGQGKDRHKECRTNFMVEKASKPEGYVFVDNVKPKPSTGGSGGGVSPEEVTTIVKEQFPGGVGNKEVTETEIYRCEEIDRSKWLYNAYYDPMPTLKVGYKYRCEVDGTVYEAVAEPVEGGKVVAWLV
jgi:hypothetical protein